MRAASSALGARFWAYASEDRLCHVAPGETVEVVLKPIGCCDTGRGSGDFTCAIRAQSGATTVYGNGMGVSSVAL